MDKNRGETARTDELSDQDRLVLVDQFVAANLLEDKTERNGMGRQIMGYVFSVIGRTELSEEPYVQDGAGVQMQDGTPATLLDYLAIAIDQDHGLAATVILNFAKVPYAAPGTSEAYDRYTRGLTERMDLHMAQQRPRPQ